MQISCLNCFRKHIATAMVFEDEAAIGGAYPLHKWLAIGELNAAEKEVAWNFPILATITRNHRIAYQEDNVPFPTLDLIKMADDLENAEKEIEKENSQPVEDK